MISKIQIAKSKVYDVGSLIEKENIVEKEIRVLINEIIRETNISELCCKEGIDANLYYKWSKDFLDVTQSKLAKVDRGDTLSSEIDYLKNENKILRKLVVELQAEVQMLKERLASSN